MPLDDFSDSGLIGFMAAGLADYAATLPSPMALDFQFILGKTGELRLRVFAAGTVLSRHNSTWGGPRSLAMLAGRLPLILARLRREAEARAAELAPRVEPAFSSK